MPMVGWYDPLQLIGTGIQSVLSSQFGAYADRRETMAAVSKAQFHDFSEQEGSSNGFWVDYVADVGDGWDSTYSIAWLMAQNDLSLGQNQANSSSPITKTTQGNVLVMGGDQVYPVASQKDYQMRMLNLYATAFYDPENHAKPVFAIPGNHDWYDGLNEFEKIYCRNKKIGQLETHQNRSYFALKFPDNWWLYAIDVQLVKSLDKQQISYFEMISRNHAADKAKIIVCVAEPSWVYASESSTIALNNTLDQFIQTCIHGGADSSIGCKSMQCPLVIAGDLHHYARYQSHKGEQHFVTAGGGGAFLHPTHNLPGTLPFGTSSLELQSTFPPNKKSRLLLLGNLLFAIKNRGFCLLIALTYLLFAWLLESSTSNFVSAGTNSVDVAAQPLLQTLATIPIAFANIGVALSTAFEALQYSPMAATLMLMLIGGLFIFSDRRGRYSFFMKVLAILYGLAHALNVTLSIWIFARINIHMLHFEADSAPYVLAFFLELVIISGGLCGGLLMGSYLLISNLIFRAHDNEAFSSLKNEHYKCFLRIHIDGKGLTLFPIGLERACSGWKETGDVSMGNLRISPNRQPNPILIESPIFIPN